MKTNFAPRLCNVFVFRISDLHPDGPAGTIYYDCREVQLQPREIDSRPGGPNCAGRLEGKGGRTMSLWCGHRPAVRLNAIFVKSGKRGGGETEAQE